jgi:hypothetical protein
MIESALSAPSAGWGWIFEKYKTIDAKAAALMYALAKSQACIDGNKRVALLFVDAFVLMNGYRLNTQPGELADMILPSRLRAGWTRRSGTRGGCARAGRERGVRRMSQVLVRFGGRLAVPQVAEAVLQTWERCGFVGCRRAQSLRVGSLPSSRSWVRVPSSALTKSRLGGFFVGEDLRCRRYRRGRRRQAIRLSALRR